MLFRNFKKPPLSARESRDSFYFFKVCNRGTIARVRIAEINNSAIEFVEITVARSFWIFPSYTFEKRKKIPPSTKTVFVKDPSAPAKISPALFFNNL